MKSIRYQVIDYRKELETKELTEVEVARLIGCSRAYVSRIALDEGFQIQKYRTYRCPICGKERIARCRRDINYTCNEHKRAPALRLKCYKCGAQYEITGKKRKEHIRYHSLHPGARSYCQECAPRKRKEHVQ